MPPVEVLEQFYPVLFEEFSPARRLGRRRPLSRRLRRQLQVSLRRGEARASLVMDHGRVGPPGVFGGMPGLPNMIEVCQSGERSTPAHLSKDQDVKLKVGNSILVRTPGGGGFGVPSSRRPELISSDLRRGYYNALQIKERFTIEPAPSDAKEELTGSRIVML